MNQHDTINTWLFDLDQTLYSNSNHVGQQIYQRMGAFIMQELGLKRKKATALQKHYFQSYGTTCRGLMLEHNINPDSYLRYVNDVDLTSIHSDPILSDTIQQLPGKKYIVTNSSKQHAINVCERLGITQTIDDIFDVTDSHYVPKPRKEYYQHVIDKFNIAPQKSIFFDDLIKNCQQAKQFSMTTVLISDTISSHQQVNDIDYISNSVYRWVKKYYE